MTGKVRWSKTNILPLCHTMQPTAELTQTKSWQEIYFTLLVIKETYIYSVHCGGSGSRSCWRAAPPRSNHIVDSCGETEYRAECNVPRCRLAPCRNNRRRPSRISPGSATWDSTASYTLITDVGRRGFPQDQWLGILQHHTFITDVGRRGFLRISDFGFYSIIYIDNRCRLSTISPGSATWDSTAS